MNNNDLHKPQSLPDPQALNSGKSKRSCKSCLNPNAAEFVPSYIRCADSVDISPLPRKELDAPLQVQKEMDQRTESSTTLVNQEFVGDANLPQKRTESQIRHIQRQMFNLLKQMGNNQNLPLAQIQFTLTANGQGVSVQFMMPETAKTVCAAGKQKLDADACQAATVRLQVGQKPTKGQALIMPFLCRMSEIITRSQTELKMEKPSTCSRCIPVSVPKEMSYTELEIEQQIEDIKAFEKLITDNGGRCYQDAFKELCDKLGLVTQDKQFNYFGCCVHGAGTGTGGGAGAGAGAGEAAELKINQMPSRSPKPNQFPKLNTNNKLDESQSSDDDKCNKDINTDDDDPSPYDWDTFTTNFDTMKTYYANAGRPVVHVNKLIDAPRERQQQVPPPSEHIHLSLPAKSSTMTKSKGNSSYPKLFRVNQIKCNSLQVPGRKAALHKDKERWRHNNQGRSTAVGAVTKSAGESLYLPNHRTKSHQREGQTKSAQNRTHLTELTRTQLVEAAANCKLIKPHSELAQVTKLPKKTILGRSSGVSSIGESALVNSKQSIPHRLLAPRSTHASQMRQSEVKRRMSLMRGEDHDIQFNDYLFK